MMVMKKYDYNDTISYDDDEEVWLQISTSKKVSNRFKHKYLKYFKKTQSEVVMIWSL